MAASRADINRWLDKLYADDNLTHLIVVCDTFDGEDYPVYVEKDQEVVAVEAAYGGRYSEKNMQKVMEVYSTNHTREEQMAERRAFHYD